MVTLSNYDCAQWLDGKLEGEYLNERTLCAVRRQGLGASCHGDSGKPKRFSCSTQLQADILGQFHCVHTRVKFQKLKMLRIKPKYKTKFQKWGRNPVFSCVNLKNLLFFISQIWDQNEKWLKIAMFYRTFRIYRRSFGRSKEQRFIGYRVMGHSGIYFFSLFIFTNHTNHLSIENVLVRLHDVYFCYSL